MTEELFRTDSYLKDCTAIVVSAGPEGIVLDRTVFYPMGGGQPGDSGEVRLADGRTLRISDTRKGETGILHIPENPEDAAHLTPGDTVTAVLDWERRHRHMRMHTALHLMCASVPGDVTGGQVAADKGRLDFDLPDVSFTKEELADRLNALIAAEELGVTSANLAELAAGTNNPEINRMLGTEGNLGEMFGLDNEWAVRAIAAGGNYGEIFAANIGEQTPIGLARGLNAQWTQGGLMYSPPFR